MNYRHAYHAGNFADVFKHAVFARVLVHLAKKAAPFRVIETHAGRGLYRLDGDEAQRTGEWRAGVERILASALPSDATTLLEPWLRLAKESVERRADYPGSPFLALRLTRPNDRLVFCEKHPEDAQELERLFAGTPRAKVKAADGWTMLPTLLPPSERRGVVLIDPPFESAHEFTTLAEALRSSLKRWERGIYTLWYPIKGRRAVEKFARQIASLKVKALRAEIILYDVERVDRLNGCGMIVLNPPWRLDEEIRAFAPALVRALARESGARSTVEWLTSE